MDKKMLVAFCIVFAGMNCDAMENKDDRVGETCSLFASPIPYDKSKIFTNYSEGAKLCIERPSRPCELPNGWSLNNVQSNELLDDSLLIFPFRDGDERNNSNLEKK